MTRIPTKILALLLCLMVPLAGISAETDARECYPPMPPVDTLTLAVCEHVVDGDTAWFQVVEDGVQVSHKVRFLGIDTPETVHPIMGEQLGGKEASDYVKSILDGQTVWLEYDINRTDRYGRQLCFIWLQDGSLLNLDLVLMGLAQVLYYGPNWKYHEIFMIAQDQARDRKLGLWGLEE